MLHELPSRFYQHSDFWDDIGVFSLFLVFVFEIWAFLVEDKRSFRRLLELFGLLALLMLACADWRAHVYRSIENAALREQLYGRVLVAEQKTDLRSYISSHEPFAGSVNVIYVSNNPEAQSYAQQLADAFQQDGWEAAASSDGYLLPNDVSGVVAVIDGPHTDHPPPTETQHNIHVLQGAISAARISQSPPLKRTLGGAASYSVYLYVGPRPVVPAPSQR